MHRIAVEILPRTGTNQAEQNFDFKPDGALEAICYIEEAQAHLDKEAWAFNMPIIESGQLNDPSLFLHLYFHFDSLRPAIL